MVRAKRKEDDPRRVVAAFVRKTPAGETVYLGIDPGTQGAIALLSADGRRGVAVDIPVLRVKRGKRSRLEYAVDGILGLFAVLDPLGKRVHAIVETPLVQAEGEGRQTPYTAYRVGIGYGIWPLFLIARGYAFESAAPIAWKSAMGLTKVPAADPKKRKQASKEFARQMARKLWPRASLARVKDHDRAEALLLASYCRMKQRGELPAERKRR